MGASDWSDSSRSSAPVSVVPGPDSFHFTLDSLSGLVSAIDGAIRAFNDVCDMSWHS